VRRESEGEKEMGGGDKGEGEFCVLCLRFRR
jgi:hypothetical protein